MNDPLPNGKQPPKFAGFYPQNYTFVSTSGLPDGHPGVTVSVNFDGVVAEDIEFHVRKSINLQVAADVMRPGRDGKDHAVALYKRVCAEKRLAFRVADHSGRARVTVAKSPEELVEEAAFGFVEDERTDEQIVQAMMESVRKARASLAQAIAPQPAV